MKYCPFRKNKQDAFELCYKENCTAYHVLEISQYSGPAYLTADTEQIYLEKEICKMMPGANISPCVI